MLRTLTFTALLVLTSADCMKDYNSLCKSKDYKNSELYDKNECKSKALKAKCQEIDYAIIAQRELIDEQRKLLRIEVELERLFTRFGLERKSDFIDEEEIWTCEYDLAYICD